MPKKTGLEVLNEVRAYYAAQSELHKDIEIVEPVCVFLTAFMTPAFRTQLTNLGINYIYEKPIQKD